MRPRRMQDGPVGNYLPGPDLCAGFETYLRHRFELPAEPRRHPAGRALVCVVKGGRDAELDSPPQGGLADKQAGQWSAGVEVRGW
ncbi:MAG: hypothetical protein ACR2MP_10725 [Streptosporangiaceae bacterium]